MYHINSKEAKPDIAYLKEQVEEMMKRGIFHYYRTYQRRKIGRASCRERV